MGRLYRAEGPIEICVSGRYESVCDIGWDKVDAQALCRQLFGNSNGMQIYTNLIWKAAKAIAPMVLYLTHLSLSGTCGPFHLTHSLSLSLSLSLSRSFSFQGPGGRVAPLPQNYKRNLICQQ